jgi:DNA repair photolyase
MMAKRFGRATEETWKRMQVRHDVLAKNFKKYDGRVMFPSSHDIVDIPLVVDACLTVIQKLLEAENDLLITSKPRPQIIKTIIDEFNSYKSQIQFRFTITSKDDNILSFWEPNAPTFIQRLTALKLAFREDFKTSVSMEPFLDYEPHELVAIILPYVTESIWIGPMNYIARNNIAKESVFKYEEIRKNYEIEHLRKIYGDLQNIPKIRFKDSMAIRLNIPTVHERL